MSQILENHLILENIFSFLDFKTLTKIQAVSKNWNETSKKTISRRKSIDQYLFTITKSKKDRFHNSFKDWNEAESSLPQLVNPWAKPSFGLLLCGQVCSPLSSRQKFDEFLNHFKSQFPPSCNWINIFSPHAAIGSEKSDTKQTIEVMGFRRGKYIPGFSFLTFSENLGVKIDIFKLDSDLSHLHQDPDLKGVLVFSKEVEDENDELIEFDQLKKLFESHGQRLAIGGLRLTNHGDDDDPAVSDDCIITFSGSNLKMASCILESTEVKDFEVELNKFKNSLDFDPSIQDHKQKTIGIVLACCGRGKELFKKVNLEIDTIVNAFPNVRFTGLYGDGEIGRDFWPKGGAPNRPPESWEEGNPWWHFYTTILVLINVKL